MENPHRNQNKVISCVFIVGGLALGISYMLFVSKSLAPVVAGLMSSSGTASEEEEAFLAEVIMWSLGLLVVLPLGLLRDISKLKFTSGIAIATLLAYSPMDRRGLEAPFSASILCGRTGNLDLRGQLHHLPQCCQSC